MQVSHVHDTLPHVYVVHSVPWIQRSGGRWYICMAEESRQEGSQQVSDKLDQAIALLSSIQSKSEPQSATEPGCSHSLSRVEGKVFF